jgi:2'-hydroxyisoflavone reductase
VTDRRQFLQYAAGAAGMIGLYASDAVGARADETEIGPSDRPLNFLFLGGTGFIGPHQIEYALARGHQVTMFNRGNRSGLFDGRVEEIVGNRDPRIDDGMKALAGSRTWDVVVDNSGYLPRLVRESVELLGARCDRYLYVSTVAVYDFEAASTFDEDGPLAAAPPEDVEEITAETYGPLKAECDRIVRTELGEKATIVRPTFIIGPGDRTDRFTYWVDGIHRGGDVVGPSNPEVAVQFVDARDLCPWIIRLAENGTAGSFNAAGSVWTREGLLWGIRGTTSEAVNFHWPSAELASELELQAPMLDWGDQSHAFSNDRSLGAGIAYRPLADSVMATLEWWQSQSDERRANPRDWPTADQTRAALERIRGEG